MLVDVCSTDGTAQTWPPVISRSSFVSFREPKTYLNLHMIVFSLCWILDRFDFFVK